MTSLNGLRLILHGIADLLAWPVMIGLLLAAAVTLVALGGTLRLALVRRRQPRPASAIERLDQARQGSTDDPLSLRLEHILMDTEQRAWRSVSRLRLLVRIGPALGLMGTLIPMAHALQGLAEGQMPALAGNMVTAFAATVLGLAISVVAYLLATTQERWARRDGAELALYAERLLARDNEGSHE
ncbi:biopolymer transport protein-like protein [Alcanivorax xiamenensis]|uniref:Biopolymer transport protein-like protein n=1 Tax=Alcanivorax xiamenensis TaxID=1177156 RepID=A0ABQ6YD56_9GAMM|nr:MULTISPECIES: MotA/TolQ/ExbB proton channel family protein [Alcanivorax]KAF0808142.1 biopolymer transport protein-like protein [Alcanivorax xiamenensis]